VVFRRFDFVKEVEERKREKPGGEDARILGNKGYRGQFHNGVIARVAGVSTATISRLLTEWQEARRSERPDERAGR
jgi:hypothetical protein